MRPLTTLICLAAGAALTAGCGAGGGEQPPRPPVRLTLTAPGDQATVHTESVELQGRVAPRTAAVVVRGTRAAVRSGKFSATVALEPGVNVIDVLAMAPAHRPAVTALRVRRQVTVRIPELAGETTDAAASRLRDLALGVRTEGVGGVFDDLVPGDPVVCGTDPGAGDRADVGSTVTVLVAHLC